MAKAVRQAELHLVPMSAEQIRDISIQIYRMRLEANSPGAFQRMIEKDGDDGSIMRGRAGAYDPLTRAYLKYFQEHGLS